MAKVLSPLGSASASGSIGGNTYSRNTFGAYVRNRTIPVNPRSAGQVAARARFSNAIANWSSLTPGVRELWTVYANATPRTDTLGQPITISGRNAYTGVATLRALAALTVLTTAPSILELPNLTLPVLTVAVGSSGSLVFTGTNGWGSVGGALLLFVSPPKSPQTNFFRSGYRFAGKVAGAATPPTSPATITLPWAFAAGQKCFWKAVSLTADGRVSAEAYGFCIVSA